MMEDLITIYVDNDDKITKVVLTDTEGDLEDTCVFLGIGDKVELIRVR